MRKGVKGIDVVLVFLVIIAFTLMFLMLGCADLFIGRPIKLKHGQGIELIGVEMVFLINDDEVKFHNSNWDAADVTLSRRIYGASEYYTDIFNRYIPGAREVPANSRIEYVEIDKGDRIMIYVRAANGAEDTRWVDF